MTRRRQAARRGSVERALGVVEFSVKNQGSQDREAALELTLSPGEGNTQQIVWEQTPQGIIAKAGDRLLVLLDVSKLAPLRSGSTEPR